MNFRTTEQFAEKFSPLIILRLMILQLLDVLSISLQLEWFLEIYTAFTRYLSEFIKILDRPSYGSRECEIW